MARRKKAPKPKDDAKADAVKIAIRQLRNAAKAIEAASLAMGEFTGKVVKRPSEVDKYGEPTWNYLSKRTIPDELYMTRAFLEYAQEWGFTPEQANIIMFGAKPDSGSNYEGFIRYYQRNADNKNGRWSRWTLVWQKWVRAQRERKAKKDGVSQHATRFERAAVRE